MTNDNLSGNVADARQRINLAWLIRLRWGAVIGQSLTVAAVSWVLNITLPLPPLWVVLMLTASSNWMLNAYARSNQSVSENLLGLVVTLDICLLTALLYYSGGSTNPFNFLYLVHIALAAVTLSARWIVALLILAFFCFGSLFWWYVPLSVKPDDLQLRLHGQGMAVAFVLAGAFIVYFVHRISRALMNRELELARSREAAARSEKLTSLATLAAGAAHELSTPLATIAVVAKELERHLHSLQAMVPQMPQSVLKPLTEDAQLVRQQVERCRAVLTHMAADAGASSGEPLVIVTSGALVDMVFDALNTRARVRTHWDAVAQRLVLKVPVRSVAQAVRQVIKNALEAAVDAAVVVRLAFDKSYFVITVEDHGPGMSPEVLAHVGEPFYTTKAPGLGMGLGLFLTRSTLEGIGGGISLHSGMGEGTTATIWLPVEDSGQGVAPRRPKVTQDLYKLQDQQLP